MPLLTAEEREVILRREWPTTPILIDHMFLPVLTALEQNGAPFDVAGMDELDATLSEEIDEAASAIFGYLGHELNLNSGPQKASLLDELGIPAGRRTATGQRVVDKATLAEIDHPVVALLMRYTASTKLRQFVRRLPEVADHFHGRIKYALNNTSVETGRLSAGGKKMGKWSVNIQQIPVRTDVGRLIRTHFVPSPGRVLYAVDASQFQLRIAAVDSGDPGFIASFAQGIDNYNATAIEMWGETNGILRRVVKTVVLGTLFGATEGKVLSTLAKDIGPERARDPRVLGAYRRFYLMRPTLAKRITEVQRFVREHGYGQEFFGRRNLYDLRGTKAQVAKALREAYNFYVQGPEAEVVKILLTMVMRGVERAWAASYGADDADILLQIHDEGVFSVTPDGVDEEDHPRALWFEDIIHRVEDEINELLNWPVRIVLDIGRGKNWAEAH